MKMESVYRPQLLIRVWCDSIVALQCKIRPGLPLIHHFRYFRNCDFAVWYTRLLVRFSSSIRAFSIKTESVASSLYHPQPLQRVWCDSIAALQRKSGPGVTLVHHFRNNKSTFLKSPHDRSGIVDFEGIS
jgi:hypothetical protein